MEKVNEIKLCDCLIIEVSSKYKDKEYAARLYITPDAAYNDFSVVKRQSEGLMKSLIRTLRKKGLIGTRDDFKEAMGKYPEELTEEERKEIGYERVE